MESPVQLSFKSKADQEQIRRALNQSPFFSSLGEEQIERFVGVATVRKYEPGEVVILEGCVDEDGRTLAENDESGLSEPMIVDSDHDGPPEIHELAEHADEETTVKDSTSSDPPPTAKSPENLDDAVTNSDRPISESDELAPTEPSEAVDDLSLFPTTQCEDGLIVPVPPPSSGIPRSIYIVKQGTPDVWYHNFRPASLRPGTVFGTGGFLFGRQHSASVVANRQEPLECWAVEYDTFCNYVLPSENMKKWFSELATSVDEKGTNYMTMEQFVEARLRQENAMTTLSVLEDPMACLRVIDSFHRSSKQETDRRIYLEDFCFYHLLMDRPDPEVDIAFILMDQKQTGQIFLSDLEQFVEPVFPELNIDSQFFKRYFGKDGTQAIRQQEFSQFLVDFRKEVGKQAYLKALEKSESKTGYLKPEEFIRVLTVDCGLRLPLGIQRRLLRVFTSSSDSSAPSKATSIQTFSYGDFLAFQEVLGNLPSICTLVDRAESLKQGPVSVDDLKTANRVLGMGGNLSRSQVHIIYNLFDQDGDGFISKQDTVDVCGMDLVQRLEALPGPGGALTLSPVPSDFLYRDTSTPTKTKVLSNGSQVSEIIYTRAVHALEYWGVATLASCCGLLLLFPLDFAKTRAMNRQIPIGKPHDATGWLSCLQRALVTESPTALYRGAIPRILTLAPEKAIKFRANDIVRSMLGSNKGPPSNDESVFRRVNILLEAFAGACAGACQLLFANPAELLKVRAQLHGETAQLLKARGVPSLPYPAAVSMVRSIGFPGLYRGANACLLRDVTFSACFFPTFALTKDLLAQSKDTYSGAQTSDILVAGTVAGVPASFVSAPSDLVKTRLQAHPRAGETVYSGLRDCVSTIYRQEGWTAFFRGTSARVLYVAPQFGIASVAYHSIVSSLGIESSCRNHYMPVYAPVRFKEYAAVD